MDLKFEWAGQIIGIVAGVIILAIWGDHFTPWFAYLLGIGAAYLDRWLNA